MKEITTKEEPKSETIQRAFTVAFFGLMAAVGVANIVIGALNMNGCGNAMVIPLLLLVNGVLWLLPVMLVAAINCLGQQQDLACLFGCLEKFFLISLAFIVASTIYVLVSALQVKTLDTLCTHSWLPPYTMVIVMLDWICFIIVFRLFCVHPLPPEDQPAMEFKHLKNLPPLAIPWNRHRALRKY